MSQNKLEWFTLAAIISLLSHLPLKSIAHRVMQAIVFVEIVSQSRTHYQIKHSSLFCCYSKAERQGNQKMMFFLYLKQQMQFGYIA